MVDRVIPLSVPNLKGNEWEYVKNAIDSEWVSTGGAYVDRFEDKITSYVKSVGAVCCQSGTAGIHTALLINDITPKDLVLVPTLTFIAAVNPIKYIGADPIFMDCDNSLTLDPIKLEQFCENECVYDGDVLIHKETRRTVKAIIVVHVFGNLADMVSIMRIADKYSLKVIEDATEALGTYYTSGPYDGKHAGTIGDVGVYSFNGNKIMTTGGGGMIVSNQEELLIRAKHLTTQAKSDKLYYEHDEIGYNYRMTNIQAAMGLAQLEQLEAFIMTKEKNYKIYEQKFDGIAGIHLIKFREGTRPNYWFYGMFCEEDFALTRDEMLEYLSKNKIQTRPIWGLIHEQIPYKGSISYEIKTAHEFINHVLNIPCSTNLSQSDVEYVVQCIVQIEE